MPEFARLYEAIGMAFELHGKQQRKVSGVPYISHLLAVAGLVMEFGGDEEVAIAAMLHDAVEDQGGHETLAKIRARFGDRVADIVEGCSDAFEVPKPPWQERKKAHLARLPAASADVRLVEAADKFHNLWTTIWNYVEDGPKVWARFRGGKDGTLWYYRKMTLLFMEHGPSLLGVELRALTSRLEEMMAACGDDPVP